MPTKTKTITAPSGSYSAAADFGAFFDYFHVRNPHATRAIRVRFDDPEAAGADADAYFDVGPGRVRFISTRASDLAEAVYVYGVGGEVTGVVVEARRDVERAIEGEVLDGQQGPAGEDGEDGANGTPAAAAADALLHLASSSQNIGDGAAAEIVFDTEQHDIGGIGSVSNNGFAIGPDEGGGYAIGINVATSGKGGTLALRVNGTNVAAVTVADATTGQLNITRTLAGGDIVTAHWTNAGGGTTTIANTAGGVLKSWMSLYKLR